MSVTNLELPYNIDPKNPFLVDKRSGPWASVNAANAGIPEAVRVRGLVVIVLDAVVGYYYKDGIADNNLVPINTDESAIWGQITGVLSNQTDLQGALDAKENSIAAGTTLQFWRGDKTWQTLNTAVVLESGNLYFTDTRARAAITLTNIGNNGAATYVGGVFNIPVYSLAGLGGEPSIAAGTNLQYWRGDKTWQTLNTDAVPEATAKYYTNARVLAYGDTQWARLDGAYTNPSWLVSLPWSKITNTPTTLGGYGITDAFTETEADARFVKKAGDTMSGNLLIAAPASIDSSLVPGEDILNLGTANAAVINIGWSGATINIQGSVMWQDVDNLAVTDKLIRLNKGGAAASGVSSGFEIEENAIITGWFATDATRTGWDFKAPGSQQLTLGLDLLTASRTIKVPNLTGTLLIDTGTYNDPSWLATLAWSKITSTPTTLSGYGITNAYTKTETDTLLLSYTLMTRQLTINGVTQDLLANRTWNVGTVTSVGLAVPTGFTSGAAVTSSGNLTLGFDAGYSLPTNVKQGQWDTAFTQTRQWDGGATGLNAATGRTSLGLGSMALENTGSYYTQTQINNFFAGTTGITGYNKSNWDTAFSWGNHAGLYSLLGHTHDDRYYTETEIQNFFSGASAMTGYNKSNWDTAFGWGNPSGVYLPLAGGIMSGDITISGQRIKDLTTANKGVYIGNWGGAGYWGLGSSANSHEVKIDQVSVNGVWGGATDVNLILGSNRTVLHSANYSSYALPLSGGTMTGQIISLASAPFSFQGNGNTGTYTQTTIYANQNNTSGSTANGIFIERGYTDTSTTEVRHFVIGARGGTIQWKVDGTGYTTQYNSVEVKPSGDGNYFVGRYSGGSATPILLYQSGADGYMELRTGANNIVTKLSGYTGTANYTLANFGFGRNSASYYIDALNSGGGTVARFAIDQAGAGTGQVALFINNNGGGYSSYIYIGSAPGTDWKIGKNISNPTGATYNFEIVDSSNNLRMQISQASGNVTFSADVIAYSDIRLKTNIRPIENALSKVLNCRGILYDRIDTTEVNTFGFVAQELEEVFPELVTTNQNGIKGVKYQNAVAVLIEAVKEQQSQIEDLKNQITELKENK